MKKNILMRLLPAMFFSLSLAAQEKIVLPYTKAINYDFDDKTEWAIIKSGNEEPEKKGKGALKYYKFSKPGSYILSINENIEHLEGQCNHAHYPEKIQYEVAPYSLEFDMSTVQFSQPIVGDLPADNIVLTVKAKFKAADKRPLHVKDLTIQSAGVGARLTAMLRKPQKLKRGWNTLTYQLKGTALKNTYIMLDFKDVNNQVQTYSYTKEIK